MKTSKRGCPYPYKQHFLLYSKLYSTHGDFNPQNREYLTLSIPCKALNK